MTAKTTVSLNFMPAFFTKHIGLTYGEAYYFDPEYRAEVECAEARFLDDVLGKYGAGSSDPQPGANIFIQPVDLIMRTQGAEWRLPPDAALESWGAPWQNLTPDEISRIDPKSAAHHPVIDAIIKQYEKMKKLHGDRSDIFGSKSGMMNTHTPFTTALQLCGQELLVLMMTEPRAARSVFEKIWDIYQAIFKRVQQATHARFERIHMGDCSASMLSDDLYRRVVLPMNQEIASRFSATRYHSCGRSSHLLKSFAELVRLDAIELGPGTDMSVASRLMPNARMRPLVDPTMMRESDPDTVHTTVANMLRDMANAPEITLCAWSFDRETPIENVKAMYEAVPAATDSCAAVSHLA